MTNEHTYTHAHATEHNTKPAALTGTSNKSKIGSNLSVICHHVLWVLSNQRPTQPDPTPSMSVNGPPLSRKILLDILSLLYGIKAWKIKQRHNSSHLSDGYSDFILAPRCTLIVKCYQQFYLSLDMLITKTVTFYRKMATLCNKFNLNYRRKPSHLTHLGLALLATYTHQTWFLAAQPVNDFKL